MTKLNEFLKKLEILMTEYEAEFFIEEDELEYYMSRKIIAVYVDDERKNLGSYHCGNVNKIRMTK